MESFDFDVKEFFNHSKYAFGSMDKNFILQKASANWLNELGLHHKDLPMAMEELMLEADYKELLSFCKRAPKDGKPADELVRFISSEHQLLMYQGQLRWMDGAYHFMLREVSDSFYSQAMFKLLNKEEKIAHFSYNPKTKEGNWTGEMYQIYGVQPGKQLDENFFRSHLEGKSLGLFDRAIEHLYSAHKPYKIEVEFNTDQGEIKHLKMIAEPHVKQGEVIMVTGYTIDVSKERRAVAELKNNNEFIELALRGIKSGIFDHNLINDDLKYGPNFSKIVGLGEHLKEQDFRSFIHPDDREPAYQRHLEGLNKPGNYYFNHYRLKNRTDAYKYYEVYGWRLKNQEGKAVRMVGNIIDVDEKYRYIQQIKESNAQLRGMINNGFISMILIDLSGEILMADEATLKLIEQEYGVNPKHGGVALQDTLPEFERINFLTEIEKIKDKKESIRKIFNHDYSDGTTRWYDLMYTPLLNEHREVYQVLLNYLDITELKQKEIIEREAKERAEELYAMKSNFLANMSHEIRTPLNGIINVAELLHLADSDEERNQLIGLQKESGQRLLDTLTGILNLSLLEAERTALQLSHESFLELSRNAFDTFSHYARKKGLEYVFIQEGSDPITVNVDKEMMLASIKNIIHNAIKFTEAGSVEVCLDYNLRNKTASLRIKDTGIGISQDKLERIFLEFTQGSEGLTRNFEGTGIGLSLARKFLRLVRGDVTVKSTEGGGSTFTISLPFLV